MSRKKVEEVVPAKKTTKKETVKKTKETKTVKEKKVAKKEPVRKLTKEEVKEEVIKEVKKKSPRTRKVNDKMSLAPKEQKALKILSRIVSIIAKIIKVCLMIVVPIIAIVSILIPIVLGKVEVSGNIVKFDDVRIVMNGDSITANIGDKTYMIADNVKNMDKVVNFLNNNSLLKLMIGLELTLVFSIIVIIINIYLLGYVEKLFDNFYRNKTPFINENADYIRKIGRVMIISLVASVIFEIVLSIVIKDGYEVYFKSYSIIGILIVYIMYYILTYATKLQAKSDNSIYD